MSKSMPFLCLASAMLLGSGWTVPTTSIDAAPLVQDEHFKVVRADYVDLAGNHPHSNTYCELVNTSVSTPVLVLNVYVVGAGGIGELLGTYSGLLGQTLPPLGRVRVDINNVTFPGLAPQTSKGNHGVANVIMGWYGGSEDSVKLTSTIIRHSTGNMEDRTRVYTEGHPLLP